MKIEINQAPLIRKFMETMRLMNIYLNHFPKHERYALCARIRTTAYAVYDLIVEGMKRYHKKTTLTALDIAHAKDTASIGHIGRALAANEEMFNRLPQAHKARIAA